MPHSSPIVVGQQFGRLTVVAKTEKRKRGLIVWECRCNCDNGELKEVTSSALRRGSVRSCGCLAGEHLKTFRDLRGRKFGRLTAVRPTGKKKRGYTVWECQCVCNNTVEVDAGLLLGEQKRSCGCLTSLVGRKFGKLMVLEKLEKEGNNIVYLCRCSCSETVRRTAGGLGPTSSCGCSRHSSLFGQWFGMLEVIRKTDQRRHRAVVWECRCDCKHIRYVTSQELNSGEVISCGCTTKAEFRRQNESRLVPTVSN